MTVIDELVTILGLDIKAGALPTVQKFTTMIDGVSKYAAWASAALMTAATSVLYFTERTAQSASELHKFGQVTGMSTHTLQGMMFAVEQVGGSAEALKSDLMGLTQSMSSPIPGEFNHALFMLGVSARKAGGGLKTADEVLLDIADKFKGMNAQTQLQWASRIGLSNDTLLLLQSGREEIVRLKKEAENIPTIVDESKLKQAREFVTQLSLVRRLFTYISQEVTSAASPALKRIVTEFTSWLKLNREFVQMGIQNLVEGIVKGFERFWNMLGKIRNQLTDLFPWLKGLVAGLTDVDVIASVVFGALSVIAVTLAVLGAKFIAVTAIVVAIAAVFDDFVTYLEGGNSAIGELIDWVKELYKEFSTKFPGIAGFVEKFTNVLQRLGGILGGMLLTNLKGAWSIIKVIGEALGGITSMMIELIDKALIFAGFADGKSGDELFWGAGAKPTYPTNPEAVGMATKPTHPTNPGVVAPATGSNTINITQHINGDNAVGVASESARKNSDVLQSIFPGGLVPVVN